MRDDRIDLLRGGLLVGVVATFVVVTDLGAVGSVDPLLVSTGSGCCCSCRGSRTACVTDR